MKLLLLSDKESEYLWDYYRPGRLDGIDLILSCGDLNSKYLSFLVTMSGKPLLYVHGNHDKTYDQHPPEGCDCIEDKLVVVKGLRAVSDFEQEVQMAVINRKLNPGLETMFLASSEKYTYLSSTIVKEMARYGADLEEFIPCEIVDDVNRRMGEMQRKER